MLFSQSQGLTMEPSLVWNSYRPDQPGLKVRDLPASASWILGLRHGTLVILQELRLWVLGRQCCPSSLGACQWQFPDSPLSIPVPGAFGLTCLLSALLWMHVRLSVVGGAGAVLSRAALVCRLGTVQIGQPLPLGLVEACVAVPVLWEVAWLC